jgi:hypothetical protein
VDFYKGGHREKLLFRIVGMSDSAGSIADGQELASCCGS